MKFVLFLLLTPFVLFAQYQPTGGHAIVEHEFYSLSYNEEHEQADWVYYRLYADLINGGTARDDSFRADAAVSTSSASLDDYVGSGYDRGHLAPAGDMKDATAMSESFFMSNMSPQEPSFNRGAWKTLEATVRQWGSEQEIYVVTGPIFMENKGTIGDNEVTVPGYYYKIAYSPADNKMIAFVMPNEKITNSLDVYVVSTDSVESLTGIDFFPQISDDLEEQLESSTSIEGFEFKTYTSTSTGSNISSASTSQQCKGITKSTGSQCKRKTSDPSGYCHQHKQ